jgi:hypothetical protein
VATRVTLVDMFASWSNWQLPHKRGIWLSVYLTAGVASLLLGGGVASALIGAVAALLVVGPLELWFRRHGSAKPGDA